MHSKMLTIALLVNLALLTSAAVVPKNEKTNKEKHERSHGWRHSGQIADLLKSYDRSLRPQFEGPPTDVEVSMFFSYAKWSKNELNTIVYLRQSWNDSRFVADDKAKIDSRTFNADEIIPYIWKPDTYFMEAISKTVLENGFVRISKDGKVLWSQRLKLKTRCHIELPFVARNDGKTNCSLEMKSYGLSSTDIKYAWKPPQDHAVRFDQWLSNVYGFDISSLEIASTTDTYSRLQVRIEVQTKFSPQVFRYLATKLIEEN